MSLVNHVNSESVNPITKNNFLSIDKRTIIIVGPTGSGKSKLAIELALKLNGEIISADSKQNFKYLDIASAKVSKEEQNLIPHHLLSFIDYDGSYSSLSFASDALKCIEDIRKRGKIPIIAGGTFYYIESLLFDSLIVPEDQIESDVLKIEKNESNLNLSPYDELSLLDPFTAKKLHPNNSRKIKRALEIFKKTGKSWIEQTSMPRECKLPALFFSLNVSQDILDSRLHKRVFDMIEAGLISEVVQIHLMLKSLSNYNLVLLGELELNRLDCKENLGIIDSIGFMEFIPLFKLFNSVDLEVLKGIELKHDKFKLFCDYFDITCKVGLFEDCIQNIIYNSIKYSKRQQRWINSRISHFNNFYTFNSSNLESWNDFVLIPACIRAEGILFLFLISFYLLEFLNRESITHEIIVKDNSWEKYNCEVYLYNIFIINYTGM